MVGLCLSSGSRMAVSQHHRLPWCYQSPWLNPGPQVSCLFMCLFVCFAGRHWSIKKSSPGQLWLQTSRSRHRNVGRPSTEVVCQGSMGTFRRLKACFSWTGLTAHGLLRLLFRNTCFQMTHLASNPHLSPRRHIAFHLSHRSHQRGRLPTHLCI